MRLCMSCLLGCAWLFAEPAYPHDSWISREKFRDPQSGDWCCNEHDCKALGPDQVWQQKSDMKISVPFFGEDRSFLVPKSRILPSRDGNYWACLSTEAASQGRGVRLS